MERQIGRCGKWGSGWADRKGRGLERISGEFREKEVKCTERVLKERVPRGETTVL
jgi:hypothetical protein